MKNCTYCDSTEENYNRLMNDDSVKKKGNKKDWDNYLYLLIDENGELGYTNISFELPRLSHYKKMEFKDL